MKKFYDLSIQVLFNVKRLGLFAIAGCILFYSSSSFSLSLTQLIEGLYANDASIKSAEAAVEESENDIKTAWAAFLPTFDSKIETGKEIQWKPDADNTNMHFDELDFTFKQKIWDFGESSSDIKQKKNALDAAVLDLHAEKSNIILDAVEAYLGYIDAAKKLESETDALNSKIESTGQEESRVKKGSGMPSDVLQAKADLAEAQKSKITAEGDLRKAFNKYVKVFKDKPPTNIDSMTLIELSLDGRNQLPKSLEDATQIALENNIDLLKKTIDLLDAEQDVVSAKSDFLPDLDFESTYKYKYNVGASAGAKEEILGKITLKVPLQPWQDLPAYRNKKSALITAELDLEEEKFAIEQTVGDLWEDYQVALLTRDFAKNKVVISGELLTIKKRERNLDQADAAAVTAAENALNSDTKSLIDDETALTETSLDLLDAIGVLSLASIQDEGFVSRKTEEPTSTQDETTSTESTATDTEEQIEAAPVTAVVVYSEEEQAQLASEAEEARKKLSGSNDSEPAAEEAASAADCASNIYVAEKQSDGSWKTVCKN